MAAVLPAEDPFFVGFHLAFIRFEFDTAFCKHVNRLLDVIDIKVKYGERCRLMVILRLEKHGPTVLDI